MSAEAFAAGAAELAKLDQRERNLKGRTVSEAVDGCHAWAEQLDALTNRITARLHFGDWPALSDVSAALAYYAALWDARVQVAMMDQTAGDEEAAA